MVTATKPLTALQRSIVATIAQDMSALIANECTRRGLHHLTDDIITDSITITLQSIARSNETDPEAIKSRARSSALDVIRTTARRASLFRTHYGTASTARHNGEAINPTPESALPPLKTIRARRHFHTEKFCAAVSSDGVLQFASYGDDPLV